MTPLQGSLMQISRFYFLAAVVSWLWVVYDTPLLLSSTKHFCFSVILQSQAHNKFNLLSIIKLG